MTLPHNSKPFVIPSTGRNTRYPSVPAKICAAGVRSSSRGRDASASPLTAANAMGALRCLRMLFCIVTVLAVPVLSSSSAHARQALPATPRASSESLHPFAAFVREASRRFTVPKHWIRAVMRVESGARSRSRSRKGAMGLMQIMPKTWAELRARYGLGADPYDAGDNILAGAAYIRELSDRYGVPGFLAAYNAGPGRYERHLKTGRPLPAETQAFVAALAPLIESTRINARVAAVSFVSADSALFPWSVLSTSRHGTLPADVRQSQASRAHPVVDLSALVPQSGNLFVRLGGGLRSP
jgi:soluble lytic murein transglycosylase-like protein